MQVNMELRASYIYSSMAFYFDRDDISLPGLSKFFLKSSEEEREHAHKLMKYMNSRGGRVFLQDIKKPEADEWGTALDALQMALKLEKEVNQSLLDMHAVGSAKNDPHFCDFIESEYLGEQVEGIKQLSDMITQLKRAGPGLGEYQFDRNLQSSP
jgi:ferritin heavy chain